MLLIAVGSACYCTLGVLPLSESELDNGIFK